MRAKSPHLVKLTGVDPLGVVLPLKRRVPIEAGIEPARVWRRLQSSASLISSDLQVGRTRGHKVIIKRTINTILRHSLVIASKKIIFFKLCCKSLTVRCL